MQVHITFMDRNNVKSPDTIITNFGGKHPLKTGIPLVKELNFCLLK